MSDRWGMTYDENNDDEDDDDDEEEEERGGGVRRGGGEGVLAIQQRILAEVQAERRARGPVRPRSLAGFPSPSAVGQLGHSPGSFAAYKGESFTSEGASNENLQRFAGFSISLTSLFIENVLAHPCIVIRRQCQINYHAKKYHLTPFSVIRIMCSFTRSQGIRALWKGMGSTFIVQGISLGVEGIVGELTQLPREVSQNWTLKQLGGHMLLKGIVCLITMPFYSASLIDTVQSDIIRDNPGILECVREGVCRVLGFGIPQSKRLLPLRLLAGPTLLHALLHYAVAALVQRVAGLAIEATWRRRRRGAEAPEPGVAVEENALEACLPELVARFFGGLVADVVLFPLETTMHRLHVQGTRTIIDNTDANSPELLLLPINTRHEGLADCVRSVRRDEGTSGLWKGVGALLLQYSVHGALLYSAGVISSRIAAAGGVSGAASAVIGART